VHLYPPDPIPFTNTSTNNVFEIRQYIAINLPVLVLYRLLGYYQPTRLFKDQQGQLDLLDLEKFKKSSI
jgi:hypothetical protein